MKFSKPPNFTKTTPEERGEPKEVSQPENKGKITLFDADDSTDSNDIQKMLHSQAPNKQQQQWGRK
jgi:hypothetical protein